MVEPAPICNKIAVKNLRTSEKIFASFGRAWLKWKDSVAVKRPSTPQAKEPVMAAASQSALDLSHLFRPEVLANPYPFYAGLRSRDPVHWDRSRKAWALTRYDDVVALASDPRMSSEVWAKDTSWIPEKQRADLGPVFLDVRKVGMFCDPPEHTSLRPLFGRVLSGRINEKLRRRIGQIANGLLDAVEERGAMDVIRDFAVPLPFLVITEILGIPPEDLGQVRKWSDMQGHLFTQRLDQLPEALDGFRQVKEYFGRLALQRRASPGKDLISALVAAENRSDAPCSKDALASCALLLTAAHINTANLICNGLRALLRYTEQLRILREQPALLMNAVEELLRYDSPAQVIKRLAREDVDIGGKTISRGQAVLLLLGAANRDPERFAEPDRLDLRRPDNRHLAFAPGPHYCLGAALGRLEGQVAFATLLQRFPTLRLADASLQWQRNLVIRGLKALPVEF
jgi:cytochrome P450